MHNMHNVMLVNYVSTRYYIQYVFSGMSIIIYYYHRSLVFQEYIPRRVGHCSCCRLVVSCSGVTRDSDWSGHSDTVYRC